MSYDLIFLHREPGQSWEDDREAAGESGAATLPDPAVWNRILAGARQVPGTVSVHVTDRYYELDHEQTGIQLSCSVSDGIGITVPYWHSDANADAVTQLIYRLGRVVEEATGLEGYDPQLGLPLSDAFAQRDQAVELFNGIAEMFARRERTAALAPGSDSAICGAHRNGTSRGRPSPLSASSRATGAAATARRD